MVLSLVVCCLLLGVWHGHSFLLEETKVSQRTHLHIPAARLQCRDVMVSGQAGV
jgi:hypothetical protein